MTILVLGRLSFSPLIVVANTYFTAVLMLPIKIYARLMLRIYCRKLAVNKPEWLQAKGPLLIAANHPASFLDGIILTTLMEETLYSLARGDAFTKKWRSLLYGLNLLPVYRTSEGTQNLAQNYATFSACHEVFEKEGVVLIFSEAVSLNEWKLRPLRKGTARLAISSWQKGIDLTVLPLGFNYSSFKSFGKVIHLHFGSPINRQDVLIGEAEGRQLLRFNQQLEHQLKGLVYDIDSADEQQLKHIFKAPQPAWKKILLLLPGIIGWLCHAPLYYSIKAFARKHFDDDHFDAVVAGGLLLLYPLYLLLCIITVGILAGWVWCWIPVIVLPFCAWAVVRYKDVV